MKNYFLIYLPFLLFSLTYIYLIYYYQKEKIIVPVLIGTLLNDLTMQSYDNLIFKISRVTYNKEYEDNYIVAQYPLPGSLMRPNQIISIEVNNNKNKIIKNLLYKYNKQDVLSIKDYYKKEGIAYKIINFHNKRDNFNSVISAYDKNKNLTYIYFNDDIKKKKIYVQNLIGQKCNECSINSLISCYNIDNKIIENCSGGVIINQFPLPGLYSFNLNNIKIYVWHELKNQCNI